MGITAVMRATVTGIMAMNITDATTEENIMDIMALIDITEGGIIMASMDLIMEGIGIMNTTAGITAGTTTGIDMVGTTETEDGVKKGNGVGIDITGSITIEEDMASTTNTMDIMEVANITADIMEVITVTNTMGATGTMGGTAEDTMEVIMDITGNTDTVRVIADTTGAAATMAAITNQPCHLNSSQINEMIDSYISRLVRNC